MPRCLLLLLCTLCLLRLLCMLYLYSMAHSIVSLVRVVHRVMRLDVVVHGIGRLVSVHLRQCPPVQIVLVWPPPLAPALTVRPILLALPSLPMLRPSIPWPPTLLRRPHNMPCHYVHLRSRPRWYPTSTHPATLP
jgi:hypothetical protein